MYPKIFEKVKWKSNHRIDFSNQTPPGADAGKKRKANEKVEKKVRKDRVAFLKNQLPSSSRKAFNPLKDWVVQEKVHGANLRCTISCNDSPLTWSSRRRALNPLKDSFFGFQAVERELREPMANLYATLIASRAPYNMAAVHVFGELCGGVLDGHQPVRTQDGFKIEPVQTELQYFANLRFYAFDIAIEWSDSPGILRFLDQDETLQLFVVCRFPLFAKPLFVGPFEEAIDYPEDFPTTVGEDKSFNAEGIVVKPIRARVYGGGQSRHRVVLKRVSFHFLEKMRSSKPVMWQRTLMTVADSMVHRHRIASAISKIGPVSEFFDAVIEETYRDVLLDLVPLREWQTASKQQQLDVRHSLRQLIIDEINDFF